MSTQSQNDIILNHLKAGNTLTRAEAMLKLGIANLTARVSELRQEGYNIADEWLTQRNRRGDMTKFKQYRLMRKARA